MKQLFIWWILSTQYFTVAASLTPWQTFNQLDDSSRCEDATLSPISSSKNVQNQILPYSHGTSRQPTLDCPKKMGNWLKNKAQAGKIRILKHHNTPSKYLKKYRNVHKSVFTLLLQEVFLSFFLQFTQKSEKILQTLLIKLHILTSDSLEVSSKFINRNFHAKEEQQTRHSHLICLLFRLVSALRTCQGTWCLMSINCRWTFTFPPEAAGPGCFVEAD